MFKIVVTNVVVKATSGFTGNAAAIRWWTGIDPSSVYSK